MHISLRVRLDSARDRLVLEFEPGAVATSTPIAIDGMKEPAMLELDEAGYVVSLAIPGLSKALAAIAGEKPGKVGK